ncbi:MAG: peptidoglycan recognition family protein [Acidobacteriota bacterium]
MRRHWPWLLLLALNALFLWAPWGTYQAVVVHHTASSVGDAASIRRAHWQRGWAEVAYHAVLANGSTAVPRGHLEPTWRYRLGLWSVATRSPRFNVGALHLVVVGNYEDAPMPEDLQRALGHALREIIARHRIADDAILLHRDCSATACPGRFVDRGRLVAWTRRGDEAPATVRAQHARALASPHLPPLWYCVAWLLANLGALALSRRRSCASLTESSNDAAMGLAGE